MPPPGYEGNDQATFMAEFEGKRYKIVVELHVWNVEALSDDMSCPEPTLIKVNGKPVSSDLGSDFNVSSVMDSLNVDASSITVNFANQ